MPDETDDTGASLAAKDEALAQAVAAGVASPLPTILLPSPASVAAAAAASAGFEASVGFSPPVDAVLKPPPRDLVEAIETAAEGRGPIDLAPSAAVFAVIAQWMEERIHNSPVSQDTPALNHFRGKLPELIHDLEAAAVPAAVAIEAWFIDLVTSGPSRSPEALDYARQAINDLKRRFAQE